MHFERYGTGPRTFLALHGWGSDHRTFAPIVADLPADASVFAPDLPGQGQSAPPALWTLDAIQRELEEFIQRIPQPVTLIGNCSGALLGLRLAQRLPNHFSRLVLIDTFAWCPWYFRLFLSPILGQRAYLATFANPLGRWITNLSLAPRRTDSSHLTRGFSATNHHNTYQYLRLLGPLDPPQQFKNLSMPIDILYGQRTFAAIRSAANVWHKLWPDSRVFCLKGAGHLPLQEASSQVRGILFRPNSSEEVLCPAQHPSTSPTFAS